MLNKARTLQSLTAIAIQPLLNGLRSESPGFAGGGYFGFLNLSKPYLCSAKTAVSPSRVASPLARFSVPWVARLLFVFPGRVDCSGASDDPDSAWLFL